MSIRLTIKGYIQPFERRLALEELSALTGTRPRPVTGTWQTATTFETDSPVSRQLLRDSLAYWETIENLGPTAQVLREATANVVRNGIDLKDLSSLLPFTGSPQLPNRRSLRYGVHGIHEYRGKFFPQLVLSLINVANVKKRSTIVDPMSGSGTTLVEACSAGHNAFGLDLNPLSVLLGKVKCQLLTIDASRLTSAYHNVRSRLLIGERPRGKSYVETLPAADSRYLRSWFSTEVLQGLDIVVAAIKQETHAESRNLMLVSLSNILRRVSWQKDDDLRIRKEIRTDIEIDPVREFLEELGRSVRSVLALRYQNQNIPVGNVTIHEGDARSMLTEYPKLTGRVDLIITSPPYATALPYLDTDRLSLCYLQLLSRPMHRARDYDMIGNRELTESRRRNYLALFHEHANRLPKSVRELVGKIDGLNAGSNAGFRRKNLPALLAKYFLDMSKVLAQMKRALKPGAIAFLVVGNNHTVAGGTRVGIRTAQLLQEIADDLGLEVAQPLSMEMLVSRDIFRNNAGDSESILAFRKR